MRSCPFRTINISVARTDSGKLTPAPAAQTHRTFVSWKRERSGIVRLRYHIYPSRGIRQHMLYHRAPKHALKLFGFPPKTTLKCIPSWCVNISPRRSKTASQCSEVLQIPPNQVSSVRLARGHFHPPEIHFHGESDRAQSDERESPRHRCRLLLKHAPNSQTDGCARPISPKNPCNPIGAVEGRRIRATPFLRG